MYLLKTDLVMRYTRGLLNQEMRRKEPVWGARAAQKLHECIPWVICLAARQVPDGDGRQRGMLGGEIGEWGWERPPGCESRLALRGTGHETWVGAPRSGA